MGDARLESICKVLQEVLDQKGERLPTDAQLLERFVASRDEAAFELLVRRHSRTVWNVCRRVLGREHDAEDAFQATFLTLTRKAGSIVRRTSVAGWLRQVARRVALKAKTRATNQAIREQQRAVAEAVEDPTPACVWQEVRSVLNEEIERLPRKYRLTFVLCHLEGKTYANASRESGCSESTIASRLAWARQRLARQLSRRGVTLPAGLGAAVAVDKAAAAVPASLIPSTVRAGLAYATGDVRTGVVSAEAVTLAEGLVHTMLMTKIGVVLGVVMSVGLLAGGAGFVVNRKSAPPEKDAQTKGTPDSVTSAHRVGKPQTEVPPEKRLDQAGDVLPAGALARLGTLRFRHEYNLQGLAYTLDGKILIGGGQNIISFWDSATGEELRRLKASGYISLSRDGKSLAGAWGDTLWMRDLPSGRLRWQKKGVNYWWPKLAYAPDNKVLTTGGNNGIIQMWDVASGKLLGEVTDRFPHLGALTYSPDGNTLACAWDGAQSGKATVRAWDIASGTRLWQQELEGNSMQLAYAPDGRTLAVGGANGKKVYLWDATTAKEIRLMDTPPQGCNVHAIVFSPDNKSLAASCGSDDTVRLWDPASGKLLWQKKWFSPNFGCNSRLIYAPDSKTLAIGSSPDGIVHFLKTASGEEISPNRGHEAEILGMAYAQGSKTILTAGCDGTMRRWDFASGRQLSQIKIIDEKEASSNLCQCIFSPDCKTIATCTGFGVNVWDTTGKRLWHNRCSSYRSVLAYAPDGKSLAVQGTGSDHFVTKLLDVVSGKELWQVVLWGPLHNVQIGICPELIFSPDNRTLGVTVPIMNNGEDKFRIDHMALVILDAVTGKELRRISLGERDPRQLTYSPDGKVLAAIVDSSQGTRNLREVCLWEVVTGQKISQFQSFPDARQEGSVCVLAFAPDGRTLACGTDRSIRLWDLAVGRESRRFQHHPSHIQALAYAPDGRSLASMSQDGTALIWDLVERNTPVRPVAEKLNANRLLGLWNDLAGVDAKRADRALWVLSDASAQAVPFLQGKLRPVAPLDSARLRQLSSDIHALDSNVFADRERAVQAIKSLGRLAIPALRQVLDNKPSLEARRRIEILLNELDTVLPNLSSGALQEYRALRVLERAGTAEARQVLKELAAGAPEAVQTREAEAALLRLAARNSP